MLVGAYSPVADEVVTGDFEHYEDAKSHVCENELEETARVAQVLLVDIPVNATNLISLVRCDLTTLSFGVLACVAQLNRECAFLDVA